jgi:membrane-bound metal-dependent hydrolase YbcI (DUF457 family)
MDPWLTRLSILLAMAAWCAAVVLAEHPRRARAVWTGALAAYLVHIVSAYASVYGWSHRVAWEMTASDTERVVGWRSGIGLAVNYAFAAALAVDLVRQWRGRPASPWIVAFVVFMILNGAVVFAEGSTRRIGIFLLCVMAAGRVAHRYRRSPLLPD